MGHDPSSSLRDKILQTSNINLKNKGDFLVCRLNRNNRNKV